jgi:hypothetical protein
MMADDYSDFWLLVAGVSVGLICGLLVGVPLWLVTGYPQFVRWAFFKAVPLVEV